MDRSASTICRELKRNRGTQVGYRPAYAEEQAWARRWRGSRLVRCAELREVVLERLAQGHSPEQVAGRLRREQGRGVICAESIYRFIYAQIRRTDDTDWRHYLPRRKYKRGYRRPARDRSPLRLIPQRLSLTERPAEVLQRSDGGHWEADLMLFTDPGGVLLVAQERVSRLLLLRRQHSKAATPIVQELQRSFAPLPQALRQTVTFDNGAEFSHHQQLHTSLHMQTYFCDTQAPWQKGGIENAIGRLRRVLPRKTPPGRLTQSRLDALVHRENHTPRKCLGFQTPTEIFSSLLLHLKCESTGPLVRGWHMPHLWRKRWSGSFTPGDTGQSVLAPGSFERMFVGCLPDFVWGCGARGQGG
jgi:IS30 family transposase